MHFTYTLARATNAQNRKWKQPCKTMQPTIYYMRQMMEEMRHERGIAVCHFCCLIALVHTARNEWRLSVIAVSSCQAELDPPCECASVHACMSTRTRARDMLCARVLQARVCVYIVHTHTHTYKHTKQLFVDLHGHSVKKNVFMYGCDAKHFNDAPNHPSRPQPFPFDSRMFPAQMEV